MSYKVIMFHQLIKNYNFVFSRKLIEYSSLLKCYQLMSLANKLIIDKVVSKKFGDVKKISLFERSEFEIFSRRAFCVLMGKAPARSLKVLGEARRGKDQSKGPNSLRKENSKALLYKTSLKMKSLSNIFNSKNL